MLSDRISEVRAATDVTLCEEDRRTSLGCFERHFTSIKNRHECRKEGWMEIGHWCEA
jgi:hypothetical protein